MAYQYPLEGGRINASIIGSTAGAPSLISTGTMFLSGGNNVTLSQNGNTIGISAGNAPAGSVNFSAGTASGNLGSVVFSNSNGIGFGLNGSVITASHNALTSQSNQALSGSNGSFTFQTARFSNANGVTFGTSAGSIMTASVATNYAASNHSHGNPTLNLTNLSGTTGSASNGFTLSLSAAAQSVQTQNAVSILGSTGNISFADGNGVTFGGNNSTITASVPATSSLAGAGAISIGTNGNTVSVAAPVQSNLSATGAVSIATNGNTISIGAPAQTAYSFADSNGIVFGTNGSTVTASVTAGGGGGVALSGGGTMFSSGTVNLSASGALVIGSSTNGYNFSVPNTSSLAATGILSISSNGNTISIGAPAFSAGTATNSTVSNRVIFSAGNNVALSQSTDGAGATIGISGYSFANSNGVSFGTNGSTVTASVAAGGGGGIALAGNGATYTSGTANLVGSGAVGISTGANQSFIITAPATSSIAGAGAITVGTNGNTISVGAPVQSNLSATGGASISTNGNTIYVGAPSANTGLYFDNMIQQTDPQALAFSSIGGSFFNRLLLQPLSPGNEVFPFNLTASTMLLNFSNNTSATSLQSAAHSSTWYFGLYSRVNSTQLSLINSASTSYSLSANTGNSASYNGARWLSFHSSRFSAPLVLAEGSRYFYGVMARTGGATYPNQSIAGLHLGASTARSGMMAAAGVANTLHAWHPFMGVHNTTTFTALPATVANSHINKATQYANFMPQVVFDAGLGQMT